MNKLGELEAAIPSSRFGGAIKQAARCGAIVLAAALMAANIKSFVRAANLFPGGFTGLAILIQHIAAEYFGVSIPFSPLIIVLNAVPAVISFRFIGKRFTLYSVLMIVLSSILTDALPAIAITDDALLAAVFGGLVNALSISLCLHAGATSGGTDFVAIFISERRGVDAWNYVLFFNACVLCVAGILFGASRALYSILFQFTSTQMLGVLWKRYQKATIFVITNDAPKVYDVIRDTTHHDATLFTGTGCFAGARRDMLYSVVSADQIHSLTASIKKADDKAFVNIVRSQGILGKFYTRPND